MIDNAVHARWRLQFAQSVQPSLHFIDDLRLQYWSVVIPDLYRNVMICAVLLPANNIPRHVGQCAHGLSLHFPNSGKF
jgi:hypothetical protein